MIDRKHTNRLLNTVGTCAVLIAMAITWNYFSPRDPIASIPDIVMVSDRQWQIALGAGHRIGSATASVTAVVFADFQCPACREFALNTLNPVLAKFPTQLAVLHRHWPLNYHAFAIAAARASECAADQGRFKEYHDALFRLQNTIGHSDWVEYTREIAGIDTTRFIECSNGTMFGSTIERDARDAVALGGSGTPMILVNGRLLSGVPDAEAFEHFVRNVIDSIK
ncbi:MAG: thioredoxin domain-containing protein [Gemmatimonadales bacterium]|nr:thioredoxin domain-containing protein [Gemmatimonadales bacterium]